MNTIKDFIISLIKEGTSKMLKPFQRRFQGTTHIEEIRNGEMHLQNDASVYLSGSNQ